MAGLSVGFGRGSREGALPFAAGPAALLDCATSPDAQVQHTCKGQQPNSYVLESDKVSGFGHLEQVWQLTGAAPPTVPARQLQRELLPDAPRTPYRRRKREPKTVCHWGQRKLLLSEVEFLSKCLGGARGGRVVYAGAAPGTHMTMLSALFPAVRFTLVDPSPFAESVAALPNVRVIEGFFDEKLALELGGEGGAGPAGTVPSGDDAASNASSSTSEPTLFISDVRTGDWGIMTPAEMEAAVAGDMEAQQRWVRALAPDAALLKFRLPWAAGSTQYLAGRVLLPLWGPATTTEARLLVTRSAGEAAGAAEVGSEEQEMSAKPATAAARAASDEGCRAGACFEHREWDNTAYMEQMCYFNTNTRVRSYSHALEGGVRGLCSCYDCAGEVGVWCGYLAKRGPRHVPDATRGAGGCRGGVFDVSCAACVAEAVTSLVAAAAEHCSPHGLRHLDTQPKHPAQRHSAWYKPKVFDRAAGKVHFLEGGGCARARGGQKRQREEASLEDA